MYTFLDLIDEVLCGGCGMYENNDRSHKVYGLKEKDGVYTRSLEVPGYGKGDLNITEKDGVITVKGSKKSAGGLDYRSIDVMFTLPEDADAVNISAKVLDGILTIDVPKKAPAVENDKVHAIEVK